MPTISNNLLAEEIPNFQSQKIITNDGESVTYGKPVSSKMCAKIAAVALTIVMCVLPFLWCIDSVTAKRDALSAGVEEVKELPAATVTNLRQRIEFEQHDKRYTKDTLVYFTDAPPQGTPNGVQYSMRWVHSSVLARASQQLEIDESDPNQKSITIHGNYTTILPFLHFLYEGKRYFDRDQSVVESSNMKKDAFMVLFYGHDYNIDSAIEESIAYLTSPDRVYTPAEIERYQSCLTELVDQNDRIFALNVHLEQLRTGGNA